MNKKEINKTVKFLVQNGMLEERIRPEDGQIGYWVTRKGYDYLLQDTEELK